MKKGIYRIGFCVALVVVVIPFAKSFHFSKGNQFKQNAREAIPDLIVSRPTKRLANGLPAGENPWTLGCIYGLTPHVPGCNVNNATISPTGGWGAIALVDAYYVANAESDLQVFSQQFNSTPFCTSANGCFNVYYATSDGRCSQSMSDQPSPPSSNPSDPSYVWWDETVLDIEMAHAMAPNAKIFLVEAQSGMPSDLFAAVDCASRLVAAAGGGMVSNSYSWPEQSSDPSANHHFTTPGIVYFGSSGDFGAPSRYPASSPNVIAAGGTKIIRDSNGNFKDEVAWSRTPGLPPMTKEGSSGGPSQYQSRPSYQNVVQKVVGSHRGTPDISFDAAFDSGVAIYSSHAGGWVIGGGTSCASPSLAGIINAAGHRASSTAEELTYIYSFYPKKYNEFWHDIISGNNGFPAMAGYDFVTGLGSPRGYGGK